MLGKITWWGDMDWIRDDKDMAKLLKKIAYINISKMPGQTTSNLNNIGDCYQIWKDIILRQIELYRPNVIYFANTFGILKEDLIGSRSEPDEILSGIVGIYHKDGMTLCDTYHPNQRIITREDYIDALIEASKK